MADALEFHDFQSYLKASTSTLLDVNHLASRIDAFLVPGKFELQFKGLMWANLLGKFT